MAARVLEHHEALVSIRPGEPIPNLNNKQHDKEPRSCGHAWAEIEKMRPTKGLDQLRGFKYCRNDSGERDCAKQIELERTEQFAAQILPVRSTQVDQFE